MFAADDDDDLFASTKSPAGKAAPQKVSMSNEICQDNFGQKLRQYYGLHQNSGMMLSPVLRYIREWEVL